MCLSAQADPKHWRYIANKCTGASSKCDDLLHAPELRVRRPSAPPVKEPVSKPNTDAMGAICGEEGSDWGSFRCGDDDAEPRECAEADMVSGK